MADHQLTKPKQNKNQSGSAKRRWNNSRKKVKRENPPHRALETALDLPLESKRPRQDHASRSNHKDKPKRQSHNQGTKKSSKNRPGHVPERKDKPKGNGIVPPGDHLQPSTDNPHQFLIPKIYIQEQPDLAWEGEIRLLETRASMENAVQEILGSGETILGFDSETRPNFVKGQSNRNRTALIQFATAEVVYLFRVCALENHCIRPLLPILTNASIIKAGVSIKQDVRELMAIQSFEARGFVEITDITQKRLNIINGGLQALSAHFLQGKISKSKKLTMSNWEKPLNARQIRYAATDAHVGREVYLCAKETMDHLDLATQAQQSSLVVTVC